MVIATPLVHRTPAGNMIESEPPFSLIVKRARIVPEPLTAASSLIVISNGPDGGGGLAGLTSDDTLIPKTTFCFPSRTPFAVNDFTRDMSRYCVKHGS